MHAEDDLIDCSNCGGTGHDLIGCFRCGGCECENCVCECEEETTGSTAK